MGQEEIAAAVRDIVDFPKPGIVFKDISPILQTPELFRETIDLMAEACPETPDMIVAIDARGFIFGAPMAYKMGCGLAMLRKKGKLPGETEEVSYDLEYGSATLELHNDSVKPGDKILIVDDVLATGGTAEAAVKLVKELGGEVLGLSFIMELCFLNGRDKLENVRVDTLIKVD